MSPLSENPRPILFRFDNHPEPMIVMDSEENFKAGLNALKGKLEEYAAKRPQMEQLPHTDPRRMMFECKTAIVVQLWQKGKIFLKSFGKTPGKQDRFDAALLQEAFTEIINELEVDL